MLVGEESPTGLVRVYRERHDARLHYFVVHFADSSISVVNPLLDSWFERVFD